MSPIFQHEVQLRGAVRGRARGEARRPVQASFEYRDDEGQPALIPIRWNHDQLDLKPFMDQEVVLSGFVGTDARGYPVLFIHECRAAVSRERSPSLGPLAPGQSAVG